MCCKRSVNTKINRLQCLRIVYNDKKSNFNERLVKDSSVSIHHQKLQNKAFEIFKASRGLGLEIGNESFQFREQMPNELKQRFQFQILLVHTISTKDIIHPLWEADICSLEKLRIENIGRILIGTLNINSFCFR